VFNADTLAPYIDMLPLIISAFVISLLATPLIGVFAMKFGFVDLPATMRRRTDPTLNQRLHKEIKPRLGALAALIPLVYVFATQINLTIPIIGVLIGLIILIIGGIIDDKYELGSSAQFTIQALAALIVVITGTSILSIQVFGVSLDFTAFSKELSIFGLEYMFVFPADIITFFWIMTMINAVNWVCGIDALGELLTAIAAITTTMLSIRFGNPELAIISAVLAAGILGYVPYNFPPAKIIGGTAGHTSFGYLISVLAMLSGAKITTGIILLIIPLVDMIWVMFYRIKTHTDLPLFKRPFVSGKVHLHHRLMDAGYSQKQVLLIEGISMGVVAILAVYFGGFANITLVGTILLAVIIVIFALINIKKDNQRKLANSNHQAQDNSNDNDNDDDDDGDDGLTPEEKFAY